ncbi:PREDICTED: F-box/kelch-repeat protein At3g23880-like [Fragaria vesca subsp. vesca]|uniref:F-box/kelch-repeat protein At3g23880-like n=1 Tax=Fragaria vesca subsp. vesca TaxID=101020 RepID=UPI0002C35E35|nr:PREDICTED: F-box/kelch-repeat protein At3g23880-like [Fragaria vesca subsp. vesca]
MAELSKLPQEMKVQILSRLPPKSLMRFKCIHRSWHALIRSPSFAAKHVFVSKHNKVSSTATILFKRSVLDLNTDKKEILLSWFDLCDDNNYCVDHDDHLIPAMEDLHVPQSMGLKRRDIWSGIEYIDMACHCNGIICLTDYRKRVVLCNPAIKEFNLLPVSSLALSSADITPTGYFTAAVGFGCDLESEIYKVVRIFYSAKEHNDNEVIIHPPKAEVFSLVTGSWKEIKTDNLDKQSTNVWPVSTVCIYCKGILYWRGHEQQKVYLDVSYSYTDEDDTSGDEIDIYEDIERIISFDIGSETFHVINFPNGYYFRQKVLGLWNDSIAVSTCWCEDNPYIDIWVLDNICVEGSWINCLTVEPVVNFRSPLAFVVKSTDQSLWVAHDDCVLILYDLIIGKFKYLPVDGCLSVTHKLFFM